MKQVVIENPVINSPFEEPGRHFLFSEEGITNEILEARRVSSYFVPILKPKKKNREKKKFGTRELSQGSRLYSDTGPLCGCRGNRRRRRAF